MNDTTKKKKSTVSEEQVANFLKSEPEFFMRNAELLNDIVLTHETGAAISLVERQLSVMRTRNQDLRDRLDELMDNAKKNDQLFTYCKHLILALLDAEDLGDLIDALLYSFDHEFHIEHTRIILFDSSLKLAPKRASTMNIERAKAVLKQTITESRNFCGNLNSIETELVFGHSAPDVGSSAIVNLSANRPLGIIAIGNKDPLHYRGTQGTVFLNYLGDVISRILPRHLSS